MSKEEIEDDRKSVRFNLEKELKVSFEIPTANKTNDTELPAATATTTHKNNSYKNDGLISENKSEKQGNRQIEVDFDDLDICLSEEKLQKLKANVPMDCSVKMTEQKKFKPSQILVKEFREIFESNKKSDIKFRESINIDNYKKSSSIDIIKSSQSNSSSSRSIPSQDGRLTNNNNSQEKEILTDDENKISEIKNLFDETIKKTGNNVKTSTDLGSKIFDSTLDDLVDFTIKKKLDLDMKKDFSPTDNIKYRDKDFLLEEILNGNDDDDDDSDSSDDLVNVFSQNKELEYLEKLESQLGLENLTLKTQELDEKMNKYDKIKEEKMIKLEKEYEDWLKNAEKSFDDKKEEEMKNLKKKFEESLEKREIEMEEKLRENHERQIQNKLKNLKEELLKLEEKEMEKLKIQIRSEQKDRLNNLKMEMKKSGDEELEKLKKTFEMEINDRKAELMKNHKEDVEKIERNMEDLLSGKYFPLFEFIF